jgi:hypothetical protein
MTWTANVLVVANLTATSDDLLSALKAIAERSPTRFTIVVPATALGGGREAAAASLQEALDRFGQAGLTVDGHVGDADPCVAVSEAYDRTRHDAILVCTLPLGASKWLHAGLPERIARLTDAPVTHVVAHPRPPEPHVEPAPARRASLGPLLAPYAALGHSELPHPPEIMPRHDRELRRDPDGDGHAVRPRGRAG